MLNKSKKNVDFEIKTCNCEFGLIKLLPSESEWYKLYKKISEKNILKLIDYIEQDNINIKYMFKQKEYIDRKSDYLRIIAKENYKYNDNNISKYIKKMNIQLIKLNRKIYDYIEKQGLLNILSYCEKNKIINEYIEMILDIYINNYNNNNKLLLLEDNLQKLKQKYKNTMRFEILNDIIKENNNIVKEKGFINILDYYLDKFDLPLSLFDLINSLVNENISMFADINGLRDSFYKELNINIPFDSAKKKIILSLSELGKEYFAIVKKLLKNDLVDTVYSKKKTKMQHTVHCYDTFPYIILNYQNNYKSLFDFCHELGHSVHTFLSNKNNTYYNCNYSNFWGEIVANVNENILIKFLKEEGNFDEEYINYLDLENFSSVFLQNFKTKFQIYLFNENNKKKDEINCFYYNLIRKYKAVKDINWKKIVIDNSTFYSSLYPSAFVISRIIFEKIISSSDYKKTYFKMLKCGNIQINNVLYAFDISVEDINWVFEIYKIKIEDLKKYVKNHNVRS